MSDTSPATAREPFPSLLLSGEGVTPRGSFAEQQAAYLEPDAEDVGRLRRLLEEKNAGLVAHFYMDAELQGVLFACDWPHIHVSDSLLMADSAIEMAKAGIENIIVLGVDFMSENVRAMLDDAGFEAIVKVYRVAEAEIGCSLAASGRGSRVRRLSHARPPSRPRTPARRLHQHQLAHEGPSAAPGPDHHLHVFQRGAHGLAGLRARARDQPVVRPRHLHGGEPSDMLFRAPRQLGRRSGAAAAPRTHDASRWPPCSSASTTSSRATASCTTCSAKRSSTKCARTTTTPS